MIKITNEYIDKLGSSEVIKTLLKKEFTCKTSYCLAIIFHEIDDLSEVFVKERQKIIDRHAKKDDNGEVIQKDNNIPILDVMAFQKDLKELLEIELDFQKDRIVFDIEKEPKCTVEEMLILLPLIEVKDD